MILSPQKCKYWGWEDEVGCSSGSQKPDRSTSAAMAQPKSTGTERGERAFGHDLSEIKHELVVIRMLVVVVIAICVWVAAKV